MDDPPERSPDASLADPLRPGDLHRVRSYSGRQGRMNDLTRDRLARLGPARSLPPGPLDPPRAFGRRAPVVVEIGSGHGASAVAYAAAHPDHDLVALEVHVPGLARMLALAEEAGVGANLWAAREDAVAFLEDRVRPGQLDVVHLFFPDPWPKERHTKRRFVNARTLDLLESRLAPGGHVLVATDDAGYAAYVLRVVAGHDAFEARRVPRPAWRPTAGFEAKGVTAGREIVDLRLTRRRGPGAPGAGDENRTRVISLED